MKKSVFLLFILLSLFLIIINSSNIKAIDDNSTQVDNKITLKLNWDENNIINGKEFDVEVETNNLLDKTYDVKVFIFNEDKNKPISQVYYNDKWLSSTSYMNEFISGPGDTADTITMRINNKFKDFKGEANIGVRIREHGSKTYQKQFITPINILEDEKEESTNKASSTSPNVENSKFVNNSGKIINQDNNNENLIESPISEEVIHLGTSKIQSESIKSKKNIVYESKNELFKKYSIYGFIGLLIIFLGAVVFLMIGKKIKYGK